ncbi:MAG TPA: DNA mismatch repair protein MutS [Nitrospirae bacterium]|nr:DNA mismatch repair protein MutS [Nitrospirota bacterium]
MTEEKINTVETTPLMKQYYSIKENYPEHIIFFRLGDFYEMFDEDAKKVAPILQIALTSRNKNKEEPIPMCGVPFFSADLYINKLIRAGFKVALCEQVEDSKLAKGIVQREVVKVITPGTYYGEDSKDNVYIMSIFLKQGFYGITVADLSTGEFIVYQGNDSIDDEITRYEPKEVLIPASLKGFFEKKDFGIFVTHYEDWYFDYAESYKRLLSTFNVSSLEAFGCENMHLAIISAGVLIKYLTDTLVTLPFKKIQVLRPADYMYLDSATKRNLELTSNLKNGSEKSSLIWVLDQTQTAMGARFMRGAITKPLISVEEINKRLIAVNSFVQDYVIMEELRTILRNFNDLQRLTSKVISSNATPKDLQALKNSLSLLPKIRKSLLNSKNILISELGKSIPDLRELYELIDISIADNPPTSIKEGGIIKKGFNEEIDDLRAISKDAKDYIANLEIEEKHKTGILSLKVGYNKVFGYYIEVTNPNLHLVPPDYIRKQTLSNCERFITPDLKTYETKVLNAEERLKELEAEVYQQILNRMQRFTKSLFDTANTIALIDFYLALATVAKRNDYVRPIVNDDDKIEIIDGRHPVVERMIRESLLDDTDKAFVANDVLIDSEDNRMLIITGPNMAGKSTFMRQTAIITLMAQIGSFVPAASATVGITDRIFTRIGASDYISQGQSTFMVEMLETANILNNATSKSLIILDEIGRGTSTYDGISIAWAIAEFLLSTVKARTLFATHYNELTELQRNNDGVRNYNVVVKEWGDSIVFMRKVEKGVADKSYGIQVARLAGIPERVIIRAKEVLKELEKKKTDSQKVHHIQMKLFPDYDSIQEQLQKLDIDAMTPQKALKKLKELKNSALLS